MHRRHPASSTRLLALPLVIAFAGCVMDSDRDSVGDEGSGAGGKSDQAGNESTTYSFHGAFRVFNGLYSQLGELSGSFEMARPDPGQIDTSVRNVTYELSLDADTFHSAYTLRSATDRDRSYAEWGDTGLQIFIEQRSPLTADASHTVIDARSGTVIFEFLPHCDPELRTCHPGAISGFDFLGSSRTFPPIRIEPIGPFELTAD